MIQSILFIDTGDYQLFNLEPGTGVITIAKEFEEDDLVQPATLVVRVSKLQAIPTISFPGKLQLKLKF